MQVKVFEAEDMASTLKKVRESLGSDALILSTRTVRKKGLGLLGKPLVEITAAIDGQPAHEHTVTGNKETDTNPPPESLQEFEHDITYDDIWHTNSNLQPSNETLKQQEQLIASDIPAIREEIKELKGLVLDFAKEMANINKALSVNRHQRRQYQSRTGDWLSPIADELTNRGICAEAAETIIRLAEKKLTPKQVGSPKVLDVFFKETIAGLLQVNGPVLLNSAKPKRMALIGPTGVGKTTTIAKLAAAYLKNFGKKLALITIDTYRIAAVEQLKVYGEIMNLPVEVVMAPHQLDEALARHKDKKLILIDTAGRSPRDEQNIQELATFLRPELGIENHLVLSATSRERELHETVKRFRNLSLTSFIFTKLDECESFGALINIPAKDSYPLSYLTNGQRVPEDLMLADPKKIAGLIMGDSYSQRSNNAFNA